MTTVSHSDRERRREIVAYECGYTLGAQRGADWSNDRIQAALRAGTALLDDVQLGGRNTEYFQGLADAFAQFSTDFVNLGFDKVYPIGYGFHPALSTETIVVGGHSPTGSASFDFAGGRITATRVGSLELNADG